MAASAGQMTHPAERQHLRAVFVRGHVANSLALSAHGAAFGSKMAVSINLQLHSAIAEDSFRHHGHHIHAVDLGRNNEGSGFVVRIGRTCADRRDKRVRPADEIAVPIVATLEKWNHGIAARDGAVEHNMRIQAYKLPRKIAVTIACSSPALFDVAEDRTGVATDYVIVRHAALLLRPR